MAARSSKRKADTSALLLLADQAIKLKPEPTQKRSKIIPVAPPKRSFTLKKPEPEPDMLIKLEIVRRLLNDNLTLIDRNMHYFSMIGAFGSVHDLGVVSSNILEVVRILHTLDLPQSDAHAKK